MKVSKLNNLNLITRIAVVAALYVVLSLVTFPIASGYIQFRISEALTLLPLIFPECAISVFVGCILTNIITGCAIYDIILGSVITLVAGILTAVVGKYIKNMPIKLILGGIFPVYMNAFFLPLIWLIYTELEYVYMIQVLSLVISEALAVYAIGIPMVLITKKILERK